MSLALSAADRDAINSLSADERYDHLIDGVLAGGQLWSLANGDDWVVMSCDGDECLPIWPHADYAALFANDDWADCQPRAIALETFLARWVKGLTRDNTLIAAFPNGSDEGLVVTPDELAEALGGAAKR